MYILLYVPTSETRNLSFQMPSLHKELYSEGKHEAAYNGGSFEAVCLQLPYLWRGLQTEKGHAASYGTAQGMIMGEYTFKIETLGFLLCVGLF